MSTDLSPQQPVLHAIEVGRHLRGLAATSQTVQKAALVTQEELQWIALEVHDRVAQTLASAFQQLQTLESMSLPDANARKAVMRARMLVREAIRESRDIMKELHPPLLDEFGVVPLVEEDVHHFQEDTGCQVKLEVNYPIRSPRHVEIAIYRVFHEALINVRRHAPGARSLSVTLIRRDGVVSLQVEDDGPGFDVKGAAASERVGGLMSMRRRTEIIGGTFSITSRLGHGTKVTMSVPTNGGEREEDSE